MNYSCRSWRNSYDFNDKKVSMDFTESWHTGFSCRESIAIPSCHNHIATIIKQYTDCKIAVRLNILFIEIIFLLQVIKILISFVHFSQTTLTLTNLHEKRRSPHQTRLYLCKQWLKSGKSHMVQFCVCNSISKACALLI